MRLKLNKEELITEGVLLEEDEFCERSFNNGKISVIGRLKIRALARVYLVKCSVCSEDPELFGEGYFTHTYVGLENGCWPCGCGRRPKFTEAQWLVKCRREAEFLNPDLEFIGFSGTFNPSKAVTTKLLVRCHKHGDIESGSINTLFSRTVFSCRLCGVDKRSENNKLLDSENIAAFMATGAYPEDTQFWKSYRQDTKGRLRYWNVFCPVCLEVSECLTTGLRMGNLPCSCRNRNQRQAYINLVKDGENILCVKFGISTSAKTRRNRISKASDLDIVLFSIHQFNESESCQKAERYCKARLDCGVISKGDLKDGYSETTYTYNIDTITKIYEAYGGYLVYKLGINEEVVYDVSDYSCTPRVYKKKDDPNGGCK